MVTLLLFVFIVIRLSISCVMGERSRRFKRFKIIVVVVVIIIITITDRKKIDVYASQLILFSPPPPTAAAAAAGGHTNRVDRRVMTAMFFC
jgi:hypothetical protein